MKRRPSDEEIARALRSFAREEEAKTIADPRWDALARGAASSDEIAELERMAKDDPTAREALALFQPFGDEAQSRYAAAITAEVARSGAAATSADAAANDQGSARAHAPPTNPAVTKRRVMRWIAPASAALAVAAAVALGVVRRPHGDADGALPSYAITFSGGEATSRGGPSAALPVLEPGSRFVIALRPATAVRGPIGGRIFLVQGEGAEVVDAEIKVSADGAVRFAARLGAEIHARPGDAEIVAVVARPEALPSPPVDAAALAGDAGKRRVVRQRVRIAEKR